MRVSARIAQSAPKSVDGGVQAPVEKHVQIGPQKLCQLLSANELAGSAKQTFQDLKRLLLQLNAQAEFTKLALSEMHFEDAEPKTRPRNRETSV